MEDLSLLRVWSVPSIMVTRRLTNCGVEVSDDNELVTIVENEESRDVYFREGIVDHSAINFELLEYFINGLDIGAEDINLANRLMSAPITELAEIMEKYDISLPGDSEDDEFDSEESDDENDDDVISTSQIKGAPSDALNKFTVPSSTSHSDLEGESVPSPPDLHSLRRLREVIPSFQSLMDNIVQRATNFQMSDASAVTSRVRDYNIESENPHHALPIRIKNSHSGGTGSLSLEQPATKMLHVRSGDGRTSEVSEGHVSSYQTPVLSPERPRLQERDTATSVSNIRYREIGFRGEFLVTCPVNVVIMAYLTNGWLQIYHLFERKIADWQVNNWTSKIRAEAGLDRFDKKEKGFSDFTYLDSSGYMREALWKAGVEPMPNWSNDTQFHLEVKTTLGHRNDPFHVSQNQLNMVRFEMSNLRSPAPHSLLNR